MDAVTEFINPIRAAVWPWSLKGVDEIALQQWQRSI
jgi:hypothetical protein